MPPLQPLPHLLPQNRRLRHLRGISLRNLQFSRPQGRTADDAAINKSRDKLESLRETQQLHHARSSETLRRPEKLRRRSTNLAGASPITRQKQLEIAVDDKTADAFFTMHCDGEEGPIYISELRERGANFNFQQFNLSDYGPTVTRQSTLTIKVWIRRQKAWTLLLDEDLDLRLLSYIGTMQGTHFPPNSIAIHLTDGVYAVGLKSKTPAPKQSLDLATSSYNILMRLSNLDNSIQDALATQQTLTSQIDSLISRSSTSAPSSTAHASSRLALAQKAVAAQKHSNAQAQRRLAALKSSLAARRAAISSGREAQARADADVSNANEHLIKSRELISQTRDGIRGQRRRICEDLISIYPIAASTSGRALQFTVCGLPLPNSEYGPELVGSSGEDSMSAALGHAARLVHSLQFYLSVPLPYELNPFGSRSSVRDDISILPSREREFPLYIPRGGSSTQYRLDYAWFLLNKDIEALCTAQGLRVVDIRHTLPNLKYLLYVCSAGTEDIPERKKGGVRGLWAGRMERSGLSVGSAGVDDDAPRSTAGSRRPSNDSDAATGQQREELRKALATNGGARAGADAEALAMSPPSLSFGGDTKLTLRTKGLRENVGS